jgi:triacylglycerol lipase
LRRIRKAFYLDHYPDPPLVRTRYPVVLVHGFGSLGTVGQPGLLHRQARFLREHGILAFAPNVTPYDTTPVRCGEWVERLGRIFGETGAEKVSLIGYSAGGLDARHLVSTCGFGERVAAVVTINTPHRGSELAEWTLSDKSLVRRLAIGVMELSGSLFYSDAQPHVEAGLRELTPRFMREEFNPRNRDVDGVYYASWASAAGKGTATRITPALILQNRILYGIAGVNDGMVPLPSARWGELLGTAPSDHLRMAGVVPGSRTFSSQFFLDIARHLAERDL